MVILFLCVLVLGFFFVSSAVSTSKENEKRYWAEVGRQLEEKEARRLRNYKRVELWGEGRSSGDTPGPTGPVF